MDPNELRQQIEQFYEDRRTGDHDRILQWFSPRALVSMNGSGVATAKEPDTRYTHRFRSSNDEEGHLAHIEETTRNWKLHGIELIDILVDGDVVVVRATFDIEGITSGKRARTEFCEHFRFAGERIASMITFFDTALIRELSEG